MSVWEEMCYDMDTYSRELSAVRVCRKQLLLSEVFPSYITYQRMVVIVCGILSCVYIYKYPSKISKMKCWY